MICGSDPSLESASEFRSIRGNESSEDNDDSEDDGMCQAYKAVFLTAQQLVDFAGTYSVFHPYAVPSDVVDFPFEV